MYKPPRIFGIYAEPGELRWTLGLLPFAIIIFGYAVVSQMAYAANPDEKILPTFLSMAQSMWSLATEADPRTGGLILWVDTGTSLMRVFIGVGCAALVGLLVGINLALFPGWKAIFGSFVTFLGIIPPLMLMSYFFYVLGSGEAPKITLIFYGTVFLIAHTIEDSTSAIPKEQVVKALTLGASKNGLVYRVILPQIMPRLLTAIRQSLGAAWLFVISAEMMVSEYGLGYRSNLMLKYQAMDIIIPYALWMALIGVAVDWFIRILTRWLYPWYTGDNEKR